jgi:hypothetical protein
MMVPFVWSMDATEEAAISDTAPAGTVPTSTDATSRPDTLRLEAVGQKVRRARRRTDPSLCGDITVSL